MNTTPLVWIDVETTGLNPTRDALLEIAVIVTDPDLNPLEDPYTTVIDAGPVAVIALLAMDEAVRDMHTRSGLLDALPNGHPIEETEAEALAYVRRHVPTAGTAPLAGSSVGFDRSFLAHHMPTLAGHLHYRNVDVSTIRELTHRWLPDVYAERPQGDAAHRALPDILASISELSYWRRHAFRLGAVSATASA